MWVSIQTDRQMLGDEEKVREEVSEGKLGI